MDKEIREFGVLLYQLQDNKFYVLSALVLVVVFVFAYVYTRKQNK